jgi:FMN reductase (NADPH)
MNATIKQIHEHCSIRKFKSDPVTEEQLTVILKSAQMASSSKNMQAYSVIRVKNTETRKEFAALAGNQQYIVECPLFLVWCADLNRIRIACSQYEDIRIHSTTENFILATVDTAIAAQNAALAAESLGLGIVYIGGIRNNPRLATELLRLPKLVYPLFGMCIGYPDQEPTKRPRLPLEIVLHEEVYSSEHFESHIDHYDKITREYFATRAGGNRDSNWSKEMVKKMELPLREDMRAFLFDQGFELL